MRQSAIFLDRDGTITVDIPGGYTYKIEDLKFEEGAIEGLRMLKDYLLIITTGQSGIGRGLYSDEQYHLFSEAMLKVLKQEGISIAATYYCSHHPEKGLGEYRVHGMCREAKTGMIEQAVREFQDRGIDIELSSSFVIGDKTDDGLMGNRAGCRSILVRCPSGKKGEDGHYICHWDYTANNLQDAAQWILEGSVSKNQLNQAANGWCQQ